MNALEARIERVEVENRTVDALRVAVIDEPTWHALDPDRATLRDVDVPADLPPSDPPPGGAARPHLG